MRGDIILQSGNLQAFQLHKQSPKKDGESHQYSLNLMNFKISGFVLRRRGFMADNFPIEINSMEIHYYPYARARAIS